jgi:hypothetical protein
MAGANHRVYRRLLTRKGKVAKVEPWSDRAAYQGVAARRTGCLPAAGRHRPDRSLFPFEGAQPIMIQLVTLWGRHPEIEWRAFIEVPDLVRLNTMPAAHAPVRQEEVDGRECRARAAPIVRMDGGIGAIYLAIIAAFGVRTEPECCNKDRCAIDQLRLSPLAAIGSGPDRALRQRPAWPGRHRRAVRRLLLPPCAPGP